MCKMLPVLEGKIKYFDLGFKLWFNNVFGHFTTDLMSKCTISQGAYSYLSSS